jgi:hypothetical protein
VRTLPTYPSIACLTGQISNFLHSQLADAQHQAVLKDAKSLSFISMLENMNLSPDQEMFLASAEIPAWYPSVNKEDGLEGMCWFMKKHIDIPDNIQKLYPHLA